MSTLPRPSRPSMGPPTGPLPSVPAGPRRQSSSTSLNSGSPATPNATRGLPHPSRTASSSSIPTTSTTNTAVSPATVPSAAAQERGLRKKPSYNMFPKPASSATPTRPSSQHSTASARSTTPRSSTRASALVNGNTAGSTSSDAAAATSRESRLKHAHSESALTETTADGDASEDNRGRHASHSAKDKGNVVISVRIRPEKDGTAPPPEWTVDGRQASIAYAGKEATEFNYDNVFTANDKNGRVYDAAAKRLVRRVMEGYHGTVFAYGMTGTGKTYSMQGTATSPGVIPLAITDIFSFIRETPQREFLLRVSYLEIYNERIHDLLSTPTQAGPGQPAQQEEIKIREDSKRGVYVTPLKEEIVQSPTQLLRVIARGDNMRRTAGTQYNARSSRSHAVVQIVVESRERVSSGGSATPGGKRGGIAPGGVRVSTLSLIDLAGSERAAESKERRTEGSHINKSLLTLGTVISKLSGKRDKNGQPMDKDGKHLPYRDSKLTRLLQPALSGNSLISILCTVQTSPSSAVAANPVTETLNTLKFAARARNNITSHAKRAEESHAGADAGSRALLDRYRTEILDLRKQLESQKLEKATEQSVKDTEEEERAKEIEAEHRHEEQMLEMQLARTALKERIEHLNRLILSSKSIGVNTGINTGRTYSTLSTAHRGSAYSTTESFRSLRTSTSTHTFNHQSPSEVKRRESGNSYSASQYGDGISHDGHEDLVDETGDGTASLTAQIKSLQEDLADKNRYIQTLEKRLLQARRSSRSRLSMSLSNRNSLRLTEDGTADTLIREKDDEIADLRARLEDKDRMLEALKSAARKRDTADNSRPSSVATVDRMPSTSESSDPNESLPTQKHRRPSADAANLLSGRTSRQRGSSASRTPYSPASPMGKLLQRNGGSPVPTREPAKRSHGVDEMTRMLDEMIRQKVEASGKSGRSSVDGQRSVSRLSNTERSASRLSTTTRGPIEPSIETRRTSGWDNDVRRRRASMKSAATTPIAESNGSTTGAAASANRHKRSNSSKSQSATSLASAHKFGAVNKDDAFASETRGYKAEKNQGSRSRASSAASGGSHASTVVLSKATYEALPEDSSLTHKELPPLPSSPGVEDVQAHVSGSALPKGFDEGDSMTNAVAAARQAAINHTAVSTTTSLPAANLAKEAAM